MKAENEINESFKYHKPFGTMNERFGVLREKARELAILINISCPDSREKSIAFTKLEESIMWANKSIAVNEKEEKPE